MRSEIVCLLLTCSLSAQTGHWGELDFPSSPSGRYGTVTVYDSARDRVVVIGGTVNNGSDSYPETWENDGTQWLLRSTNGPEGSRLWNADEFLSGCFDSQRQRTVVVRYVPSTDTAETWEWDGNAWELRAGGSALVGRSGFAMAYDSLRGVTVLFGGETYANGHFSDTWEWDGTTWLQRSSGGPQPRQLHAMTFDPIRGVVLLFGGRNHDSPSSFADTWEWNGSYWLEHFGVPGPIERWAHSMTFDSIRGVAVLHGGASPVGGGGAYDDTWEWDGFQWILRADNHPCGAWTSLCFDSERQRTVMFGGRGHVGPIFDVTRVYSAFDTVASAAEYGTGCLGPAGVPHLVPISPPVLGESIAMQLSNLPTDPLNLVAGWLGFDDTQWNGIPLPLPLDPLGFPGCTALLAPSGTYLLPNVFGISAWLLPIPFLPEFVGAEFFAQAAVLVPGFNPGGLVFSNGVSGVIGR